MATPMHRCIVYSALGQQGRMAQETTTTTHVGKLFAALINRQTILSANGPHTFFKT